MIALRPYQRALVAQVIAGFNSGIRTAVLQSGTGSGKTHTASGLIEYANGRGHRTLFLAHLDALVSDTHARLAKAGVVAGFVQAGRPADPSASVQVASLQTLHARGERPPADFVIVDECHRAMSASVRGVLDAYPKARLLGLTATPQRGDGRPLGDVFEHLVTGPSNRWLTDHGFLVPCDVLAPAAFHESALVEDPVLAYGRETPGARAIVFAANVEHALQLSRAFDEAGFPSACLLGTTPRVEREKMRARIDSGELRVLIGVGVFIEGFDLPSIETIVMARPFSVTGSFLQAIGRGLRPSPASGKTRCTVIDLRGSVHLHGLPDDDRVWSLTGAAVRRADISTPLRRCTECFAVFRPVTRCPRCGAIATAAPKIPRVLNRAERLEKWNALSPGERERRYLERLRSLALKRMHMPPHRAEQWAQQRFAKRFRDGSAA